MSWGLQIDIASGEPDEFVSLVAVVGGAEFVELDNRPFGRVEAVGEYCVGLLNGENGQADLSADSWRACARLG